MRDIGTYLDRILYVANLAPDDAERVRSELSDHIDHLVEIGRRQNLKEDIIMDKIENEFGNPDELGKEISKAHGEFRTWLKFEATSLRKEVRMLPYSIAVGTIFVLLIGFFIVGYHSVTDESLDPMIPKGNGALINRLAGSFKEGDIVSFRDPETKKRRIGVVGGIEADETYRITFNEQPSLILAKSKIKGRVFLHFR